MSSKFKRMVKHLEDCGFAPYSAGAGSNEYHRGKIIVSLLTDNSGAWEIVHADDLSNSIASGYGLKSLKSNIR